MTLIYILKNTFPMCWHCKLMKMKMRTESLTIIELLAYKCGCFIKGQRPLDILVFFKA